MKSLAKSLAFLLCVIFFYGFISKNIAYNPQPSQNSGKYKIKSGIVRMNIETSMMKGTTKATLYFDDYGKKESTETMMDMEMMGQKIKVHQLTLIKGEYVINVDLDKKMCTKMKIPSNLDPTKVNFENLTSEMIKEYNIKKEGSETVLGKKCDIYSMFHAQSSTKGKVWVWNGISIKSEMNASGINIKTTTTKIEENVQVPASKFEVPSGIKIQEM